MFWIREKFGSKNPQKKVANPGLRQFLPRGCTIADKYRPVFSFDLSKSVTAFYESWIQGHDIEKCPKPEFFLHQPPQGPSLGPTKMRVEKQFARIVPRLSVNVHRAGVVRGMTVVDPERISEPS